MGRYSEILRGLSFSHLPFRTLGPQQDARIRASPRLATGAISAARPGMPMRSPGTNGSGSICCPLQAKPRRPDVENPWNWQQSSPKTIDLTRRTLLSPKSRPHFFPKLGNAQEAPHLQAFPAHRS